MAAATFLVGLQSATDLTAYTTAAATPAAGDLLIGIATGATTVAAGTFSSSDAGKTGFSKRTSALYNSSNNTTYAFVADQLADADSQTFTMDFTGDGATGCNMAVINISGITLTGLSAIRQFKIVENVDVAVVATPEVIFDAACLTGNPTIFIIGKTVNSGVTTPTGWTERLNAGHGTPNNRLVVDTRDSGFTGTTITAGGAAAASSLYCVIGIEVDASAGGGGASTGSAAITEEDDTLAATGTLPISGTASITEANDTLAGTGTLPISGTATITEGDDTLAATGSGASASTGSAAITEGNDTLSAAGTVGQASSTGGPGGGANMGWRFSDPPEKPKTQKPKSSKQSKDVVREVLTAQSDKRKALDDQIAREDDEIILLSLPLVA